MCPDARFGASPDATRDALLLSAQRSAIAALHTARGANVAGWAWGEVHALNLHHALDALLPAAPASRVSGPPSGGDGSTVNARWWAGIARPQASGGALFRAVVDVGDWDASRAINAPGQSGIPGDPHYADLAAPWSAGATFPFTYSPAAIAARAETGLRLEPAR